MRARLRRPVKVPRSERSVTSAPSASPSRVRSSALMRMSSRLAPVSGSTSRCTIELNCLPRRVDTVSWPSARGGRVSVTGENLALPSGVAKRAIGKQRRAAPLHLIALCGQRLDAGVERHRAAISRRIAAASSRPTSAALSGHARAITSRNTHHSALADPMRRPGISGEKITRRSVEVSVPPPGDSYRVVAGSSSTSPSHGASIDEDSTMSWCTRRRGLPERGARPAARRRASRGNCRRRSRTGPRRPRAACAIISPAVHPCAAGTGKRHACSMRPRASASRRGTQPTSAPPCTPEWPRMGTRPRLGRPGRPRARPTLTSAFTVSTPCACCVRPIDHTNTALGRAISRSANSTMRSRDMPLSSHDAVPADLGRPGAGLLEAGRAARRTNASSMPPRSTSASSTPSRNARSPPVCTSNQWSASAVPLSALSAIDGIQ